ncbi:Alpha/Beta hydrolase protein [Macrophomina phaseolina]|uniref:Alpha/Beta hydrolase protein n=1 Tax=Macrophomina phaseolina TaxID=35725 RepID=A0ABQ8GBB7_9PEZI|nr:Alpha/Beta hydrolase protein [Macrophomina phaseolina]
MASYPPGRCCITGVKHEGTAVGKFEKVGGVDAYVTYPEDKSTHTAVLFLTDAMGHASINAHLIADQLAANGYFVVMPDLFAGDPVPADVNMDTFDLQGWLAKHQTPQVDPIVAAVLKEMRGSLGCKRVASVGYCFGAKYVVRNLKGGELIDAAFIAHPSLIDMSELEAITQPLSIAAAEDDFIFPTHKRRESEDLLAQMKATYQVVLYSGTSHGFATRADLSQKHLKFAKEQAFLQAVQWFNEYIKA